MSRPVEVVEAGVALARPEVHRNPVIAKLDRAMAWLNRAIGIACMLALLAAACILTYSVVTRYFLKISTDWQDEASVFLLVGAVFLSAAFVQSIRGHVGIEALASLLPTRVNEMRLLFVDILSAAFCMFFAWKSWTLLHHAIVEGHHSSTSWGPPLWIPYSTMAVGMTLLCAQILLQIAGRALAKWK